MLMDYPYQAMRYSYVFHETAQATWIRWLTLLSVMVAETVSLGVLSLPAAVAVVGLVP